MLLLYLRVFRLNYSKVNTEEKGRETSLTQIYIYPYGTYSIFSNHIGYRYPPKKLSQNSFTVM